MKLTTRSRYGLRAITYIASQCADRDLVPLSEIAENLNLSDAYLEQLLRLLKQKGLITSSRGVKGGYSLTRDPREITVLEVLNILEGEFWLSDCAISGDCPKGITNCTTRLVINRMNEAIYQSIAGLTLADLVETTWAV